MVYLRGMIHEGWYMVLESKLWYDYIIIVRSGNADQSCRRVVKFHRTLAR